VKVLSLFDGMSCGQIALDQLGIPVDKYYASEIDKYAIKVTQANYPNTIQVGDICDLDPKDYKDVNLMLAGSPCQGFSFAGKQLAFDDPRSALFFEFIRLLKAIKPKYFLLENVRMKKEFLQVISEQVSACYPEIVFGIEPMFINSSLVSAQSRQRYYWTNIPNIKQPEDRGIVLRDILETQTDEKPVKDTERNQRHYRNDDEKSLCMTATMYKGAGNNGMTLVPQKPKQIGIATDINGHDILKRVYSPDGKSPTVNTCQGGNREPKVAVQSYREVRTDEAKAMRKMVRQQTGKDHTPFRAKKLEPRKDGKVGTVTPSLNKDHEISIEKSHPLKANYYKSSRANFENDRSKGGKFSATGVQQEDLTWRKLTPLECERLQTVPDNYTNHVSNTQRYKMLGNGWTVEVIKHILQEMDYAKTKNV
jgi:DNA (cytosine-5)-methyltransferase 3A